MKTMRQHTRDRHEDRCEREEKLGHAMDTLPGKTLRDRTPAGRKDIPRSQAERLGVQFTVAPRMPTGPDSNAGMHPHPAALFSLFGPDAGSVHIAGTFNDWNPLATPLNKWPDGTWHAQVDLKRGTYEYRFIVDGNWQEDPLACDSVENPYGSRNSIKHIS